MRSLGGPNSLKRRRFSWIEVESNLLRTAEKNFPADARDHSSDRILLMNVNGSTMWCKIPRGEIPLFVAGCIPNNMPVMVVLERYIPTGMKECFWGRSGLVRRFYKGQPPESEFPVIQVNSVE